MPTPSERPTYCAPSTATAGETLVWLVAAPDTPPGDGWACAVVCTAADGTSQTVTATQETAATFRVTVPASVTTALGAGMVRWVAMVTQGTETYALARGQTILRTLAGQTANEARYAELDQAIRALAVAGTKSYAVGTSAFTKYDLPELIAERNRLAARIQQERGDGRPSTYRATATPVRFPGGWPA